MALNSPQEKNGREITRSEAAIIPEFNIYRKYRFHSPLAVRDKQPQTAHE